MLSICLYGDPALNKKTKPLKFISEEERDFFNTMVETMYQAKGVGLAANQVGVNRQMLVIDVGTGLIKMANPKIIKKDGKEIMEEGCLSLPDISVKVCRAKNIVVTGINEYNQRVKLEAKDMLARAFQHEVDHLNGKLIIDYASWYKKIALTLKKRAKKAK